MKNKRKIKNNETVKTITSAIPNIFTVSATLVGFADFLLKLREAGYEIRRIRKKQFKL